MSKFERNGYEDFILKHSSFCIIMIYNITTVFVFALFYYLIPILMGYAPNFIESTIAIGASYTLQFAVGLILVLIIGTIAFSIMFRGISKWKNLSTDTEQDKIKLKKIRKKALNLPYIIFIGQTVVVGIIVFSVIFIAGVILLNAPLILIIRIFTIVFSLFTVVAVFAHIFSKNIFKRILIKTFNGEGLEGFRMKLTGKIFLQILPLFVVAILFTALFGYTRLIEEKGNMAYIICKSQLVEKVNQSIDIKDEKQLLDLLDHIKVEGLVTSSFVVSSDGKTITTDGKVLNPTLVYCISHPIEGDRVYGNTNEMQGVIQKVKGKNGDYIVGIEFLLDSNQTANYFVVVFIFLIILNAFVLYYFSKSFTDEISLVAESLNDIAEGDQVNLDRKLAVTSNDEIADLVIAFNKIQDREKEHIAEIREHEAVLSEQQHLASLGQLIGGIAHNLRTPIMSLSGGIEGLKELINEYHNSIGDNEVTDDDHFEIVKEMRSWIEKMRPYCSYMTDIISAVKDQTIIPGSETGLSFTLDELEKRIEILIDHEIRKRRCRLNIDFDVLKSTVLKGEISSLVQVLNNIIVNAAHSYEGKGGDINMKVTKNGKFIEFSVSDKGCGIPQEIKKKLFKDMVTTKGKKGTGLGIYMSYSNIKARFGGKMWFESEVGKGTTFHVAIPDMNEK